MNVYPKDVLGLIKQRAHALFIDEALSNYLFIANCDTNKSSRKNFAQLLRLPEKLEGIISGINARCDAIITPLNWRPVD